MQSNAKKIIILIILVVLVVAAALVLSRQSRNSTSDSADNNKPIDIQKVDLSKAQRDSDKVPEGMPTDIPLEYATIADSYRAEYMEKNVVQYTVSYRTGKSALEKYNEYLNYMTQAGYEFDANGRDEANTRLYGVKNNDDLQVVVANIGTGSAAHTLVHVTFLDRR